MKKLQNNKYSEFTICKSDYYKNKLLQFVTLFLFAIAVTPWFLRVKPIFLILYYGIIIPLLIYYVNKYCKTLKDNTIVVFLNKDGVKILNNCFHEWNGIEYVKVRIAKREKNKFEYYFYLKLTDGSIERAPISSYIFSLTAFRHRINRVLDYIEHPDKYIYDIPSEWDQTFHLKKVLHKYSD